MQLLLMLLAATLIALITTQIIGLLTKEQQIYTVKVDSGNQSRDEGPTRRNKRCANGFIATIGDDPHLSTIYDLLEANVKKKPDSLALGHRRVMKVEVKSKIVRGENKKWEYLQMSDYEWITYRQASELSAEFGAGLVSLGFEKYDKLAIFENTCPEWIIAAQGVFSQSGKVLTVYSNLDDDSLVYALSIGKVKYLYANVSYLSRIESLLNRLPLVNCIIVSEMCDKKLREKLERRNVRLLDFAQVKHLGKKKACAPNPPVQDDVAMIMFTSGSTSMPKGVILTHKNIFSSVAGSIVLMREEINVYADSDVYISFLPFAHILTFMIHVMIYYLGVPIGFGSVRTLFNKSMSNCLGDMCALKPTLLVSVPLVYERIKSEIELVIANSNMILRGAFWTFYMAKYYMKLAGLPTFMFSFFFKKISNEMGGRLRLSICGGAPLNPAVQKFIQTVMDIRVLQGYGLTETSGPVCVQLTNDYTLGTCGTLICAVEIKLVKNSTTKTDNRNDGSSGEIWIRGPLVSSGYYKMPEETLNTFTADGWLKTGDVGEWTPEGTIKIIYRIKSLIKPLHGEYVSLERVELAMKNLNLIDYIMAYADSNHNDLVAIIVPKRKEFENWLQTLNISSANPYQDSEIKKKLLAIMLQISQAMKLSRLEFLKAITLIEEEWTPEKGMISPSGKMKRYVLNEIYKDAIENMYKEIENC